MVMMTIEDNEPEETSSKSPRERLEKLIDGLSVQDKITLLRILVKDGLQPTQIADVIKDEMLSREVSAVIRELLL